MDEFCMSLRPTYMDENRGEPKAYDGTGVGGEDRAYDQVLLADAYGGYNGVVAANGITRAGCWAHWRRRIIEEEKAAPEIAREAIALVRAFYAVEKQASALLSTNVYSCARRSQRPIFLNSALCILPWLA
jgi:hypothetical protein